MTISMLVRISNCPLTNASRMFALERFKRQVLKRKASSMPTIKQPKPSSRLKLLIALLLVLILAQVDVFLERQSEIDAQVMQAMQLEQKRLAKLDVEKQRAAQAAEEKRMKLEQDAYVSYISDQYYIARRAAVQMYVQAREMSSVYNVPTSLILAVIAKESGFNPFAGSKANAEGLMQVIPFWHGEKMKAIGGEDKIITIEGSIQSGTEALAEFKRMCKGDVVCALQKYNGSADDETLEYSTKVLHERQRLEKWVSQRIKAFN